MAPCRSSCVIQVSGRPKTQIDLKIQDLNPWCAVKLILPLYTLILATVKIKILISRENKIFLNQI